MPWWTWILIWIALVALSLLFYVLLGIRLFRQFMATVKALGAAGEKLGHFAPALPGTEESPGAAAQQPGSAVFASPAWMRHDYHTSKSSRREDRRRRRVQRRTDRGQPQSLGDLDFT
ncbi:MAG TPA: hypothetical protein VIM08_13430 [Arthrobacter sp.]|jgi:hypothetical protein